MFDNTAVEFSRVRIVFSTNGIGTLKQSHAKGEKTLSVDLVPSTKLNSKFIITLNIKCKSTALLEENIAGNLYAWSEMTF